MKESDVIEVKRDLKNILKILNGNGKMGLCAKVSVVWTVSMFLIAGVAGLLLRVFILK